MERSVFLKEYQGRFYGVVPYFVAKFFAELPLCVFFPFLLQALTYYGVGLNSEFVRFLQNRKNILTLTISLDLYAYWIGRQ